MRYLFSSVVAVVSLASAARADLIAYEAFNHPDISNSIFRQETGVGFVGSWKSWGGAPDQTNLKISEGSLSYAGLLTEGNSVTGGGMNGLWVGLVHDLETRSDETTTKYLSFLVQPEGQLDGSFGVMVDGTRGGDLAIGKSPTSSGRYMLETFFDSNTHSSKVNVQAGETTFMVLRADLMEGIDTFTLFINPTLGEPEPVTGIVKRDLDLGQVNGIGIGAGALITVDELRWGDTFADVTPMIRTDLRGDYDRDGQLTAADIDMFSEGLKGNDLAFDLDGNGTVEQADRRVWVEDVFGTFFGDADLNKEVEFADFLVLSNNFSSSGGWADGDFDGSGAVQFADFLLLSSNYGNSATAGVAVPDPNAALLLLMGLFGVVIRRPLTPSKLQDQSSL